MTTFDNHDQSSTGTSITLDLYYDTDQSRIDFEENFTILKPSRFVDPASILFYSDHGNITGEPRTWFDCYDLSKCTEKDFRQWIIDFYQPEDCEFKTIAEEKRSFYDTWEEFFENVLDNIFTLEGFADEDDTAPKNATPLYVVETVRGYSQGDISHVIIPVAADYKPENKTLEHLIYATPLYAMLEVDGEQYPLHYELGDPYEYDKEELQAEAVRLLEDQPETAAAVAAFLIENLPEQPEYI